MLDKQQTSKAIAKDRIVQTATQRATPKKAPVFFTVEGSLKPKALAGSTPHDVALVEQIGNIISDVLSEVRNEYRIMHIHQGLIKVGEFPPPYIFNAAVCAEWMKAYYERYSKLNSPECFIPGADPAEPKIDKVFKYYYQMGILTNSKTLGKLLTKCAEQCNIVLANTFGNRKNWLLNPPR